MLIKSDIFHIISRYDLIKKNYELVGCDLRRQTRQQTAAAQQIVTRARKIIIKYFAGEIIWITCRIALMKLDQKSYN